MVQALAFFRKEGNALHRDILRALRIDPVLVRRVLLEFLRRESGRFGFHRAVVGLSGGIDSATSCALAAAAFGPENVLAVRMPYRTSSPDSMADAQTVIDQLGVAHKTIEITPMVEPLFALQPDMSKQRRGNIMARQRMIVLYDQSAAWNGLVVGTGNKTEILLGYSTLFGDAASALNPIGDLYKTQVRQLAVSLGLPSAVITKPPSADLWAGQTDEAELGFTYADADQILYLLFDERYTLEEVAAVGFPRPLVQAIWERVRRNQYKRVMPIIAKLSTRSVGSDFLYPRDWGS